MFNGVDLKNTLFLEKNLGQETSIFNVSLTSDT